MQLIDLAKQHELSLEALHCQLLTEFPNVEEWDDIPEAAMPRIQELLSKTPEIKEMANFFALPAADNGEERTLPEEGALTIAQEYGISTEFVYGVWSAIEQSRLDELLEFKLGQALAKRKIVSRLQGEADVMERYDQARDKERLSKLQMIQELSQGCDQNGRTKKASDRMVAIQQRLSSLDDDDFFG